MKPSRKNADEDMSEGEAIDDDSKVKAEGKTKKKTQPNKQPAKSTLPRDAVKASLERKVADRLKKELTQKKKGKEKEEKEERIEQKTKQHIDVGDMFKGIRARHRINNYPSGSPCNIIAFALGLECLLSVFSLEALKKYPFPGVTPSYFYPKTGMVISLSTSSPV
jgi:hypothetical protein